MPTTLTQARKLLTATELDIFAASRAPALNQLTPAQLRGTLKRARTLRDKYRDLLQRQKLATRARAGTKLGRTGAANARTADKAALFSDLLDRFTRRLAQLEAAQLRAAQAAAARAAAARAPRTKTATAPVRSSKAPTPVPRTPPTLGPTTERARAARHAMQPKVSGQQKVHAHVAARGRRNQAKRDGRR